MVEKEEQLRQELAEADKEWRQACNKITLLKKDLIEAESAAIEAKLLKDRLAEQLRVWRNQNVDDLETTDREEDIERFKKVFPELAKRIK